MHLVNAPHKYIINIKKNSGEEKDSVIFLFFLLHKRAKPILHPYVHPSDVIVKQKKEKRFRLHYLHKVTINALYKVTINATSQNLCLKGLFLF